MAILLHLFLFFSIITYSNAAYCVCKDGISENVLQKAIDYACGAGADCTQIQTNGQCFQPTTVKSHCDVAVNSYYQRKASSGATCDFGGLAVLTNSPSTGSSCLSGSSGSTGTPTTVTPTTGTPTTGNPTTGTTPTMGTPNNGMPTTGTPTMGTPATTNPTSSTSSVFPGTNLGPTGSGYGDSSGGSMLFIQTILIVVTLVLTVIQFLRV